MTCERCKEELSNKEYIRYLNDVEEVGPYAVRLCDECISLQNQPPQPDEPYSDADPGL